MFATGQRRRTLGAAAPRPGGAVPLPRGYIRPHPEPAVLPERRGDAGQPLFSNRLRGIGPRPRGTDRAVPGRPPGHRASITHIPDDIKSISATNLSFQIDDNVILKDISFEIFKGEKVAIIGDNGSGKSTLINLLLRMQDFSSGELTLNGNNIRKYDIDEYRSLFSVVSQKVNMFNTTIIENVFINKNEEPEDPEKAVRKYSDMLGPNIISRLYDTTGSEGSFLSGGEKQKIALTRALCHKRKILLLDEAASNLDFASHQKMLELVLSSTDFDIVFVVTHDHKELSRYDKILRLEKGQLTVIKQDWS